MIIIISLILLFFSKYLRGYAMFDNHWYYLWATISFLLFWFGVVKFIFMIFPQRKSLGLLLLLPIFGYLIFTCAFYGSLSANKLYCENHKDDGYYILFATKRNFSLFFYCGWKYDIWLDGCKLFQCCHTGLCSNDTILIGMLDEGKSHRNFIYSNNPTHDDIEHSKQGWYMQGDEEKFIDEKAFLHFKNSIIDYDSMQRKEANKPKGGWRE